MYAIGNAEAVGFYPKAELITKRENAIQKQKAQVKEGAKASKQSDRVGSKKRREEHLVVVKAIIERSMSKGEGSIVKLVDIEKFFDSESLRGVMNTLHMSQIPKKCY